MEFQTELAELQNAYLDALCRRDQAHASYIIDRSINEGLGIKQVYLKIILSSQKRLGELWVNGKLSVAEEHLATQISMNEIARIRPMLRPRGSREKSVVVCAVTRDQHIMGARVVADFFIMDGWTVQFLGGDLPEDELYNFCKDQQPDLVALSITLDSYFPEAKSIIKNLRTLAKKPKIMVGGGAITTDLQVSKELKADIIALTADDALEKAHKLFGLSKSPITLESYLKELGGRVREIRKSRKVNQRMLAKLANLDRAYISGVENGKQNISIGALFRVSEALDIRLEDLLVGKADSHA